MSSSIVRENLRYILTVTGMTQSGLSRLSGGIPTQQHISAMLRGKRYFREYETQNVERIVGEQLRKFSFREAEFVCRRIKYLSTAKTRLTISSSPK